MYKDDLIEARNKVNHLFQLASMVENGGMELEKCLQMVRDTSQDLIEILDIALEDNNTIIPKDVATDYDYESFFEPIDVNPETLSMIEDYLETPTIVGKRKKLNE